jgi:hypothetical protein
MFKNKTKTTRLLHKNKNEIKNENLKEFFFLHAKENSVQL